MTARFRAVLVASGQVDTVVVVVKEDSLVVPDQALEMEDGAEADQGSAS